MISRAQLSRWLLAASALLAVAAMDPPSQPIVLSPEQAVKEGRALVNEMLSARPDASTTTGTMAIRTSKSYVQFPIRFETILTSTNWISVYQAETTNRTEVLSIVHTPDQLNAYRSAPLSKHSVDSNDSILALGSAPLSDQKIQAPFAGSDFSIADLGLEFLHWPDQRLLQKEIKRSRSCRVLESINPNPMPGGYSRIKSWVDAESDGILFAQAYDLKGKVLKEFTPKDFSKVNGQWQLQEMQISNVQTDSSTTVKFDLK